MGTLWKRGRDSLHNGVILGILVSSAILWGDKIYDWIVPIIPESATTFAGEWSIPIILLGLGAILGYAADRW